MQIYFAQFKTTELPKGAFVDAVIGANRKSNRERIEGISWNKIDYNLSFAADHRKLLIVDDPVRALITSKFIFDAHEVTWTTEATLNYSNGLLTVRMLRECNENADRRTIDFQITPLIAELEFRKKVISEIPTPDGYPEELDLDNADIIRDVINGRDYLKPVVYISKIWDSDAYYVEVDRLAALLKNVAYVCIESDSEVTGYLKNACQRQNPYNGNVAIYFPRKRDRVWRLNMNDISINEDIEFDILLQIEQYMRERIPTDTESFDSINNTLLQRKNNQLELQNESIKRENTQIYESLDKELTGDKAQILQLNKRVQQLESENEGLKRKLRTAKDTPLLVYGKICELYPDEIKDIILDELFRASKKIDSDTRRGELLKDILFANDFTDRQGKRILQLKNQFSVEDGLSPATRRMLADMGFEVSSDGKHHKITYFGDDRFLFSWSKTGSDWRSGKNLASEIIRKTL